MILFKEATGLAKHVQKLKLQGCKIGFTPTMGALHAGHISLIEKSKSECDVTVASIFVNPTQFNDARDFEKYPVTISHDLGLLENAGCDILFLPAVTEIYPNGTSYPPHYELGEIEFELEGKFRPGHFQGVCQVVHRLLEIVQPDKLFMGQKDYQQCMVVKRLVQLLHLPVDVVTVETYRENTGLAMSSRNLRLTETQKKTAAGIAKMLELIKERFTVTDLSVLKSHVSEYLLSAGFNKVDYVSIADGDTLHEVTTVAKGHKVVALIAAFIGEVRLIDNLVILE